MVRNSIKQGLKVCFCGKYIYLFVYIEQWVGLGFLLWMKKGLKKGLKFVLSFDILLEF